MTGLPEIPDWFDDGIALRATGLSVRKIAVKLKAAGHRVSQTTVWHWLTPAGQENLREKYSPEKRAKHREYMREYMRKRKGNSE